MSAASTTMDAPASTTMDAPASTGGPAPSFERFGVFHDDHRYVGYQNPPDKFWLWDILNVRADGTLEQAVHTCTTTNFVRKYTWEPLGDGRIAVVPLEFLPDGTFMWGADKVGAVTLSAGAKCDEIVLFIDYAEDGGQADDEVRYLLGALCAEGTQCDFTFVWCDGQGPESC